uniref:Amidohydrolase n=1 Tax=Thermosporothrix sp. COM3 TaxID=2490863 RepID=A0A455SPI8_9CHLR|nr:amidohydrolase [Thermosporothrix sp. COM3]
MRANASVGQEKADLIVTNAAITTMDERLPAAEAVAIKDGRFLAVGSNEDVLKHRDTSTQVIDAGKRTLIPGLNDSHIHVIRGGLYYNLELRWDGVPSLSDALNMLRKQVERTSPPQWVRVVGGWSEFQFVERRMPTLEELNTIAPDTPVFVLHLYHCALLNRAALHACGYTKETPDPPGGEIQRDRNGNPTGLLLARPNAMILYTALARGPKLSYEDQINSTRQFLRELNRFGLTSVVDAGGGFQNYPDDYAVIEDLNAKGLLTLRIAYNLFTQRPGKELDDFTRWTAMTNPGAGNEFYHVNGAGEMLAFSAADFEDFPEPRPDLASSMETDLKAVVSFLVQHRWPFRLHATYNESITRFLNVFEEVNREFPFTGLRWFFDHAETITLENIERVRALGGGIAIQDRMAFQGEYFLERYGEQEAAHAPPLQTMLAMGVPVGAGTDATRVASYNPWISLYWLVTGKTVGGTTLYPEEHRLSRQEALKRYTLGSAWFSQEEHLKGSIEVGKFADLAVLSDDFFSIPEERIKRIESLLTIVGGKVVYGAGAFRHLAPPALPVSPDWAPTQIYGGYTQPTSVSSARLSRRVERHHHHACLQRRGCDLGCDCFVL